MMTEKQHSASFDINYLTYLSPDGELLQDLPDSFKQKDILVDLYKQMVFARLLDQKAINLQRTGRLGTYPSALGQEAISTCLGYCLKKQDVFFPYYREYSTQLQRGVRIEEILAYWGGHETGSNFQNQPLDFPHSIPIASQMLHASGAALAFKIKQESRVAAVAIGDGGTSEGDFYESINAAGLWQLPLVVIINNNQWAISIPRSEQTNCKTLAQKAIAGGCHGVQVDGNCPIALTMTIKEALYKARAGQGPTVIEAITYRLCDHTTADDWRRYRSEEEVEENRRKEPIIRTKKYLEQQNLWSEQDEQSWIKISQEKIEQAVDVYLNLKPQSVDSIFDYLFATMPDALWEQKMEAREFAKK